MEHPEIVAHRPSYLGDTMADAYIGISGCNYESWKHDFFDGAQRNRWLKLRERFTGLEINATFYRQQAKSGPPHGHWDLP